MKFFGKLFKNFYIVENLEEVWKKWGKVERNLREISERYLKVLCRRFKENVENFS